MFYSCSRAGIGLISKFSEAIARSTNPVSYFPARNSALRMIALWKGTVVLIPVMYYSYSARRIRSIADERVAPIVIIFAIIES